MREVRQTVCNRDCPDACSVLVSVEAGRAVSLRGDKHHPVTRGFLCYRTSRFLKQQYGGDRLLTPLRRKGSGFVPLSWEQAFELIATRLSHIRRESGPEAVLHYRSGGSLGLTKRVVDAFFGRWGPCTTVRGDICTGAGQAAQELDFGISESHDVHDLRNAKHILVWGKDVAVTSPHTLRVLKDAQDRGATLLYIDPVYGATARLCDAYVQLRPGGDFPLAMAVARVLLERGWTADVERFCDNVSGYRRMVLARTTRDWCALAGVAEEAAASIAEALSRGPTAILVGWALARRSLGGAAVRSIDALSAISGNLGISGGGVGFYRRRQEGFGEALPGASTRARSVPEPQLAESIERLSRPPVRAVWITAANPVAMLPDSRRTQRVLEACEFVVVVDWRLTDTARCADLILPTTTWLEEDDLLGSYGHHWVAESRPAVSRPPQVRSDLEIVQELARRFGFAQEFEGSCRQWKQRLIGDRLARRGLSLDALGRGAVRHPDSERVLFKGQRVATRSGKVSLLTEAPMSLFPDPHFPLALMAVSTREAQASQWVNRPSTPPTVRVHPWAAGSIPDGGLAHLESRLGELRVRVAHDPSVHPEVALAAKGGSLVDGTCFNALLRGRLTDLGEGGALYEEGVRLRG